MAIDFATLIRAGGEGLIGHRQGQRAREEQDREDARQASTEKTAQLRRDRELMEIEALKNPAPETPFSASGGGVSSRFETEADARAFADRNRPDPNEPTAARPFRATNAQGVSGTFETAEEANAFSSSGAADSITDPAAKSVDAAKFDLLSGGGELPVGALGGDPSDILDQPALGPEFQELMVMNQLRQQILAEQPGLPREAVEAEVERRIQAAGQGAAR